jgi:hypothetical protein
MWKKLVLLGCYKISGKNFTDISGDSAVSVTWFYLRSLWRQHNPSLRDYVAIRLNRAILRITVLYSYYHNLKSQIRRLINRMQFRNVFVACVIGFVLKMVTELSGFNRRHFTPSRKVSGSIPGGVAGDFSETTGGTMCPGVDSASKNEYQDTPGGESGRCVRVTTLPPS